MDICHLCLELRRIHENGYEGHAPEKTQLMYTLVFLQKSNSPLGDYQEKSLNMVRTYECLSLETLRVALGL